MADVPPPGPHGAEVDGVDGVDGGTRRDLVRVLVEVEPFHLDRPFDYLLGDLPDEVDVGWRVEVVFAGRVRRALVVGRPGHTDVEESRLRPLRRALGHFRWVTAADLDLFAWAARRWSGSRADVARHALPGRAVRVEESFVEAGLLPWTVPTREVADPVDLPEPWAAYEHGADEVWRALGHADPATPESRVWRPLPGEDVAARLAELVRATLGSGRDALVVVPDAASRVAAGLVERLRADTDLERDEVVDVTGLSSGSAIARGWLRARTGRARVVVGERRVALWPLARPGLYVVLDEANPGLKERRRPRHHAREVALERARRDDAVALLVTHVPTAATWALLRAGRIDGLTAPRAREVAAAPRVFVDPPDGLRLGRRGIGVVRDAVRAGTYAIVLAARRGEGTAMVCSTCGHRPTCPTCGSSLAGHGRGLACRTCGWTVGGRRCRDCGGTDFAPLAAGTRRLASELARTVDAPVHVMEGYDADVPPAPAVLVMTRGSVLDAPPGPVGGVVVGDVDSLMRRPSVDAPEDTLRLLLALGSWVGGTDAPFVLVTREPDAPAVAAVRRWDAGGFWRAEAPVRAPFPPARDAIAVVAPDPEAAGIVAAAVAEPGEPDVAGAVPPAPPPGLLGASGPGLLGASGPGLLGASAAGGPIVLGPVPVDGGHRLLVLTEDRPATTARLREVVAELSRDGVTVTVDVDPVDV